MPAPNLPPLATFADTRAQSALDRASRRISRHLAVLPDVGETAFHLTERELLALTTAYATRAGWRAETQYQVELAREGLCEARGPFLTAYGMAVRRHIMREDA